MSDLRTRLIRLAHSNPELRPHVLHLVATDEYLEGNLENIREDVLAPLQGVAGSGIPSELVADEFNRLMRMHYGNGKGTVSAESGYDSAALGTFRDVVGDVIAIAEGNGVPRDLAAQAFAEMMRKAYPKAKISLR